jgi:hypothetical protein
LMAASGRLGSYGATAGREFVVSKFSDASLRSAAPLLTSQIPLKEQSLSSKIGASETNAASERTLSIDDVLSGRNEPSVNGYYDPSTQRLFMFTGNSVDRTALLGAEKARNLYPIVPLSTSDLQKKIEQKK